jgi:putative ABC transport system ATP-binding protein
LLERVGLGNRSDHFPHELSGGEQQRVAIARAVATGSPVLLADEPTGELDFGTGVQILELLREQAAEGRCVLVVTHNREISRMADRVLELSSGRLVSDGPPPGGRPADVTELRW